MFDFIANTLTLVTSIALPTFLTYKALQLVPASGSNSNPAQPHPSAADAALLSPWLTYWTINSLLLASASLFSPLLAYVPLYPWLRLAAHAYLLVPGTAERLYQFHVRPLLARHEADIESLISQSHDRVKTRGLELLRAAVEWVRTVVLGEQKTSSSSSSAAPGQSYTNANANAVPSYDEVVAGAGAPQSYVQTLLARFSVASSAQQRGGGSESGSASDGAQPAADAARAQMQHVMWDLYGKVRAQLAPLDAASDVGRSRSGEETGYETIEREDVRGAEPAAADVGGSASPSSSSAATIAATASQVSGGWGSWIWGGNGNGKAGAKTDDKAKPKDE